MSGQVSLGSAGEYQADERAGVARLSWRVSGEKFKNLDLNTKFFKKTQITKIYTRGHRKLE